MRLELLDRAAVPAPGPARHRFLLRVQLALDDGGRRVVGPRVVDLDEARAAVAAAFDDLCASVDRDGPGGQDEERGP